jgi:hypothetical protein
MCGLDRGPLGTRVAAHVVPHQPTKPRANQRERDWHASASASDTSSLASARCSAGDECEHCDNCHARRRAAEVTPAREDAAARLEAAQQAEQQLERLVASAVGNVDPAEVS